MTKILCLSHTPWQDRPSRTQQLLTRLPDCQVLFVEPARKDAPRESHRRVRSNITVCTLPCAMPGPGDVTLISERRLDRNAAFLLKEMERMHLDSPILWCTAPSQAVLLPELPVSGVVYDCYRFWGEEWLDQESELTRSADVVFAASRGLIRRLSPCNGNIALLPNGGNPQAFTRRTAPAAALQALQVRPLIGRVGDLNRQTRLEPLLYAAKVHPDWHFALIGRYTVEVRQQVQRLANIHLLGQVNPLDVPEYLTACDVLFDLRRKDRRGSDVLPIRVYEYMASGKPIVLMADPKAGDLPYADVLYTAYDIEGFPVWLETAMNERPSKAALRREYARLASWNSRADQIFAIFQNTGFL